ncbi:hypothetical protein HK105_208483 [Polyrhizophydium stewartii]|uniref:Aminopeptidase P N-terminal domain-containing protein n=1 Tax=Polyrhizophydium stewartii TaxID=2732419 RepID=A0ABR4MXQ9_9FUNG|nr:hypothetical protein HK105_006044 [Polyrhizophydium stewartii]
MNSLAKLAAVNRSKVLANLAGATGTLYLRGGALTERKWTDTEERFRQESFFYYMTGVKEPEFHFTLDLSSKRTCLYIPRYSDDHALWMGPPPTAPQVQAKYAVDSVLTTDKLPEVLAGAGLIHVMEAAELPANVASAAAARGTVVTDEFLRTAITEARVIKSEGELELMRKAARISGEAHIALMKAVRPGQGSEREMQALFEYTCFRLGAPIQAYNPIIADGRSGSVLHYGKNDDKLSSDPHQMLLVDAACEYELYAADITRTFPLGGKFAGDFKTTYEIVLEAQEVVLSQLKAGVEWEDMHRLAARKILRGLMRAGLVVGTEEELAKHHIGELFFPHGLGHLIGIDVHDAGGYPAGVQRIQEPGIRYLRMRRTLQPGMVVTVEPGVYFVDAILDPAIADPAVNKFLNVELVQRFRKHVGGVRIEDDVVILENGIENLTGWVPKSVADIEAVMAASSA